MMTEHSKCHAAVPLLDNEDISVETDLVSCYVACPPQRAVSTAGHWHAGQEALAEQEALLASVDQEYHGALLPFRPDKGMCAQAHDARDVHPDLVVGCRSSFLDQLDVVSVSGIARARLVLSFLRFPGGARLGPLRWIML